jgi:hypothetical protein
MCFGGGGGAQPTAPTQLPAASLTDSRPSVNITTDPPKTATPAATDAAKTANTAVAASQGTGKSGLDL